MWRFCFLGIVIFSSLTAKEKETDKKEEVYHHCRGCSSVIHELANSKRKRVGLFDFDPLKDSWIPFKEQINQAYALDLGFSFSSVYLKATEGDSYREAAGGRFKFHGIWHLLGCKPGWEGTMGFRFEVRPRYTEIAPSELGEEIGALWPVACSFSHYTGSLIQLWWEQHFFCDQAILRIGKIDPTDYYDTYRFDSSELYFLNALFATNVTLPYPDDGIGCSLIVKPYGDYHIAVGISDANAQTTKTGLSSVGKGDYLYAAEVGMMPTISGWGKGLYYVSGWYVDPSLASNGKSGSGYAISIDQAIGSVTPFIRYTHATKTALNVQRAASLGVGIHNLNCLYDDFLGLAFGRGEPHDPSLRNQSVVEAVYRIQLTQKTQFSFDGQLIVHPFDAPDFDKIGIGSFRIYIIY